MGGIGTLILRMSERLLADGHKVTILTKFPPATGLIFPQKARLIIERSFFRLLSPPFARRYIRRHLDDVTAIPCLDRHSLCIASLISRYCGNGAAVVAMAYSPWEMKPINVGKFQSGDKIHEFPTLIFNKDLPDSQKAFMSPQVRSAHEAAYGRQFVDSIVFPIPIFEPPHAFDPHHRPVTPGLIVSVSRLCNVMKQYNFALLADIRILLDQGHNVRLDIHGEGPLWNDMVAKIEELHLQDFVHLHGNLDYKDFASGVSRARLFVGMGTAAIEAAILGIPTIIAHAATWNGTSHGYLQDQPFGIVGEIVNDMPSYKLLDFIRTGLTSSESDYALLAQESRNAARRYTFDALMPDFYRFIEKARPVNSRELDHYFYAISYRGLRKFGIWPAIDDDFFDPVV